MTRLLFILSCCVCFSACVQEDEVDYCKNHYLFHGEHRDELGRLSITMGANGLLSSELSLPASMLNEDTSSALLSHSSVYTLQTERECVDTATDLRGDNNTRIATYESQCGADNKIGQLDVVLFDNLPSLEELEVNVVTPVTQKNFAISRQCESAIFRLE